MNANYAYVDATQPDATGRPRDETRRARHSGYVGLNYAAPTFPLNVHLSAAFNGQRYDQFFPPFPEPSRRVQLDDYWLVDVALRYRVSDALELTGRAENLTDEDYEDVFGFATPGRAAFVGFRYAF